MNVICCPFNYFFSLYLDFMTPITIRRVLLCFLLLVHQLLASAQVGQPGPYTFPGRVNHVRTFMPGMASADTAFVKNASRTTEQVKVATVYTDGFGRHVQTVGRQMMPDEGGSGRRDIVAISTYDEFGRQSKSYIPYTAPLVSGNGNFRTDAFQEQAGYWSSKFSGETVFYQESDLEFSPLSRVRKAWAEGNAFARNAGNKFAEGQYLSNTVADSVVIWRMGTASIPVYAGFYPAAFLFKKVIIDANGNKTQEFRDRDNQLVLTKTEKVTGASGGYKDWICTYHVYDDLGLLRFELSPKAVDAVKGSWTISQAIANELCFTYKYDTFNRLIVSKAPGADSVEVVYDSRDRKALTRDGRLRTMSKWSIVLYDELNRPVMSGLYASAASRAALQTAIDTEAGYTTLSYTIPGASSIITGQYDGRAVYEARDSVVLTDGFDSGTGEPEVRTNSSLTASVETVVSNNTLPGITMNDIEPLSYNYYDSYSFAGQQPLKTADLARLVPGNSSYSEPAGSYNAVVTGSITGTKTRILDTDNWLTATVYYDGKGRKMQSLSQNITGGQEVVSVLHDFNGTILSSYTSHVNPQSAPEQLKGVLTVYNQDFAGRIVSTQVGLDTGTAIVLKTITTQTFNSSGQRIARSLGITGSGALESQSFEYNVNGALLGMNRGYLKGQSDNYFGYEIAYESTASAVTGSSYQQAQYNGNIAGVTWKGSSDGVNRKYDFKYDPVNRLLAADFNQQSGGSWNKTLVDFSVRIGDGIHADSAYDVNGNILAMTQMGLRGTGKATIDDLHYIYQAGSNKLAAVWDGANDAGSTLGDFKEPAANGNQNRTGTPDYDYDIDGNLIKDINKGITTIDYNVLGLPKTIHIPGKGKIAYTYDAAGRKLVKTLTDSSFTPVKVTNTHYEDGFIYTNDSLRFTAHSAGRVRTVYKTSAAPAYVFDYFVSDHMGNTRVVLTEQQDFSMYAATMEAENEQVETALFSNVQETRSALPAGYPSDATTKKNAYAARLNAKDPSKRIGPSLVLKVTAGDSVQVAVRAFYKSMGPADKKNAGPAPDMLDALAKAFANSGPQLAGKEGGAGEQSLFGNNFTVDQYTRLKNKDPERDASLRPKAYLNYVFFDEQFNLVEDNSGVKQVAEQPDALQLLANDMVKVQKSGYLYVYTSNETPQDVFFDNLVVATTASAVLEESHYYPFGLEMAGISSRAFGDGAYAVNKYKFNGGSELNDDLSLNWYETAYRSYDVQIGRFLQVDPLAARYPDLSPYSFAYNNPISSNDPAGLEGTVPAFKNAQELIDYLWANTPDHGYSHYQQSADGGWTGYSGLISTPLVNSGSSISFTIGAYYEHGSDADAVYSEARIMGNFTLVNIPLSSLQGVADWVSTENTISKVQTALDIAGNIPVFGEVFDVANAAIYFARGDKLNGMLSLSSTIPIIGSAISETRLVAKVVKKIPVNNNIDELIEVAEDEVKYYRGGDSFEMSAADLRSSVDKNTGLMRQKGVSLNTNHLDPFVQKYGGAWEVNLNTIPEGLEIKITKGTHFELVPKQPGMTLENYQNLLKQVQVYPYNTWPK